MMHANACMQMCGIRLQMYLFLHNHSTSTDIVKETLIKVITDHWHLSFWGGEGDLT